VRLCGASLVAICLSVFLRLPSSLLDSS
jgi:hypothetical protein